MDHLWSAAPPWAAWTRPGTVQGASWNRNSCLHTWKGPLEVRWPPFSDSQRPKARRRKPILWVIPTLPTLGWWP